MSYILEALKKSDQERKRGDVPGLQTVHIPLNVDQKTPRKLYVLIVVLLLLLAFVSGLLLSGGVSNDMSIDPVQGGGQDELKRSEISQSESIDSVSARTMPEVKDKTPVKQHRVEPAPKPQSKPVPVILDFHDLPYLTELEDYKQQSIPQLDFAGHVYSSSALNRSVIINGSSMSEGDSIMDGLILISITSSGVVLESNGDRFRMDILQDWSFD